MEDSDIDLTLWAQTSDSPLHSDNSDSGFPKQFGDLTMADNDNDNGDGEDTAIHDNNDNKEDELTDQLLRCLHDRHNDFSSTEKSRYRISCVTELDPTEQFAEPDIVGITSLHSRWPCDLIRDTWFKTQVYVAQKCKLPCCEQYALPHVWARRRRFYISRKTYQTVPNLSSCESDAILMWSNLVCSQEWQEGNWNERGILLMSVGYKFGTKIVSWSVMEEHLIVLSYSDKKLLVFLAARICMDTLAKNKALYAYSQQYWQFARIVIDLLKCPYQEVHEGLLTSLQLYIRTIKIVQSCFSHKCAEYASSGLFPVLLNLLDICTPSVQAMIINIIILMTMHAPYIKLIASLEGLSSLIRLASTDHQLLARRVHACLEVVSRHESAQAELIQQGVFPLAVRHLTSSTLTSIQMNCLFMLNSLCNSRNALIKILAVDNYSVVKATMVILTHWVQKISQPASNTRQQHVSIVHSHFWCTVPRQNLVLICKLCADDSASTQLVKQGLVLRLKVIWHICETETEQILVMEALAVMSRFPLPALKICQEGFLSIFAETICDKQYQEHILNIILYLGKRHLSLMLETGLVGQLIACFGDRGFGRQLYPLVLSILALFSANDKLQDLILSNEGKVFTHVLDTAFLTNDILVLTSCVTILSRLNTTVVPVRLLKLNTLHLLAYIDRLVKSGPDGLELRGLMQLQDYLHVDFLRKVFIDHHVQIFLETLCEPPYKSTVQFLARQILEMFTGVRSRRSSIRDVKTDADDTEDDDV